MKRIILFAVLVCGVAVSPSLLHAESSEQRAADEAKSDEGMDGWKWANFILLVGVLAYLGVKYGTPYFVGQRDTINRGLNEARRRREEADRRAADVDRRLANIGADIEVFRKTALAEQEAHAAQLRQQAEREMARIRANAEQQIETAGKHARVDLQRHASKLALDVAEQRVRERMNPELQRELNNQFVESLRA